MFHVTYLILLKVSNC
uniref:Uncharacterized protein n=1 Tax=Arundo donax TaxID=35708 RepID=A0A0A9EFW4_ARUDO